MTVLRISIALGFLLGVSACDTPPDAIGLAEFWLDETPLTVGSVVDFGETPVGQAPVTRVIEIRSVGNGPISLTGDPAVRIVNDNGLAYRVVQPEETEIAPGGTTRFSVLFSPRAPGAVNARVLVETSAAGPDGQPLVAAIDLHGVGGPADSGDPALRLLIDGLAVQTEADVGTIEVGFSRTVTVTAENTGDGTLTLDAIPFVLSGDDADAFSVVAPTPSNAAPAEAITGTLTVSPTACGPLSAILTVHSNAAPGPAIVALTARGAVSPSVFPGATDPAALTGVLAAVALDHLGATTIIGNPSADTYNGEVVALRDDGCEVERIRRITPGQANLGATQFGAHVAVDRTGLTSLVAAVGHPEAWIYTAAPNGLARDLPRPTATLTVPATLESLALSASGGVAVIGDPKTDSGFHDHGGVEVFVTDGDWSDMETASFNLVPEPPTDTQHLGEAVAISADGRVIAATATHGTVGFDAVDVEGDISVHVYYRDASTGDYGVSTLTVATRRREHARLIVDGRVGTRAQVALSDDGTTLAVADVAATTQGTSTVHVYESDLQGALVRAASLSVAGGGPTFQLRLTGRGDAILLSAGQDIRELRRPTTGWIDTTEVSHVFTAPTVSGFGLSGDGHVIGVIANDGGLTLLRR